MTRPLARWLRVSAAVVAYHGEGVWFAAIDSAFAAFALTIDAMSITRL